MKLGHAALWCADLEAVRAFYETYFNGHSGPKYVNPAKGFESYFIRFDGDAALEIMRSTRVTDRETAPRLGWCHISFTVGSEEAVHILTERLRADGYRILSEPRRTGDGFYESSGGGPRRKSGRNLCLNRTKKELFLRSLS